MSSEAKQWVSNMIKWRIKSTYFIFIIKNFLNSGNPKISKKINDYYIEMSFYNQPE